NQAIKEADLLLVLGARMGDRATGNTDELAKTARIIHIDIDPAEIGKNISAKIPVVGDIKETVGELLKCGIDRNDWTMWLDRVESFKTETVMENTGQGLDPIEIIQGLSSRCADDTILVTDVGQH